MAGHSKWAKVKHFKGAIDAKRAKIFAKLSKEITIATKLGGADPSMNPRLRMVLLQCRGANMPNDNIDRAIKKATGGGEPIHYEDLTYEVYGPNGVAMLLEISTDNKNRTAAEIRSLLSKNGGTIATAGAVTRLFHRKGQIIVSREYSPEDPLMEMALEAGAEDFRADEHGYEILTTPFLFEAVHRHLESKGIRCEAAEVTSVPELIVEVTDPAGRTAVARLLEVLEDHDDVKGVHSNADLSEG